DCASCLGVSPRTLLAQLCSVFKVLPLSCFFCKADSFYILSNHHFFVKNFFDLFFRLAQAFSAFT
ncbi:hypothetical protein, partial [Lactobacillus crispatus]|uniref:hypothetical protein n=1 Tax=Lactobacillus crispatus TaxID=47770 RepID=UPI001C9DAA00